MEEFLKNFALLPRDIIAIPAMVLLFATFWRMFGPFVIKRHLALLEARERSSIGARQTAEDNLNTVAKLIEDYEKKMNLERAAVSKALEPQLLAARAEAALIIESSEAEVVSLIESARSSIAEEEERLMSVVENDVESLAASITERAMA